MKKVLVLLVVSMLVSVSSAAVVSVSGPVVLNANMVYDYTIMLSGAADNVGGLDFYIGSSNPALVTMSDLVIVAAGRDTDLDVEWGATDPYQFEPSLGAPTGVSLTDGAIVTFKVATGNEIGMFDILISEYASIGKTGATIAPSFVGLNGIGIVAIPEPITVALLGLGGLFIRRRKVA